MEISFAPSIVSIARETVADLRAGKLIFFHVPLIDRGLAWEGEIVNATSHWLGEGVIQTILGENLSNPEEVLISELDSRASRLEEALEASLISRKLIVLSVKFTDSPSDVWLALVSHIERIYSKNSEEIMLRPLLVFWHGKTASRVKSSPAVKKRFLWNPLRWEDMRGLAAAWLQAESTNPLIRAWQISTYTGAANGDPFLLEEICARPPLQLSVLRNTFLSRLQRENLNPPSSMLFPKTESRWIVPENLMTHWEAGELLGMTVDRGPQVPWEKIPAALTKAYEDRMIWQEQVTSLLPTLLEFTRQATQWLRPHLPSDWEALFNNDGDKYTAVEPGKLLVAFKKHGLRIPDGLMRLLYALKDARNDLAHMAPLDAGKVAKVWEAFCVSQELYGGL